MIEGIILSQGYFCTVVRTGQPGRNYILTQSRANQLNCVIGKLNWDKEEIVYRDKGLEEEADIVEYWRPTVDTIGFAPLPPEASSESTAPPPT